MINNNNNFSGISSMSASVYYGDGQYLTGVSGGATGSNGTSGTSGVNGSSGSSGAQGVQANLLALPTDIIPDIDNVHSLGSSASRWKSISIGPGTINITDKTLLTDAEITVQDGILQINGANQLQIGELRFVDNSI